MKVINYRPSVESEDGFTARELKKAFSEMILVDKTVVDDEIVYIFKEKQCTHTRPGETTISCGTCKVGKIIM